MNSKIIIIIYSIIIGYICGLTVKAGFSFEITIITAIGLGLLSHLLPTKLRKK